MNIEVWSDVMCPFCYIGKRKLEMALQQFPHRGEVKITWRSFQLDPDLKPVRGKDIHTWLAERKGQTKDWAKQMNDRVTEMAKESGLEYNFDNAIVANSFDAHRLSHLAAKHNVQDAVEEKLFAAYFTEGKDIGDHDVLLQLAVESGIDADEVKNMLASDTFSEEVRRDVQDAHELGVRGVPFFVFDRKYAVSGAQPIEIFVNVLEKAWTEENIV